MRYKLRMLLIVLALGPPVLAAIGFMVYWERGATVACGVLILIAGLIIRAMWRGELRYENDETRKWP
jgi:hypothetical protein